MSLINLVYVSTATRKWTESELIELLQHSRERNAKRGITGMLLYKSGSFLQVLEGEEDQVMALYEKIQLDPRHHHVITVARYHVSERGFNDWQMAFMNLNQTEEIPGYSDFLNQPMNLHQTTGALRFLKIFKEAIS
ncbi:MAG: BLUF domain-containing protein [Anaerolineae bacterium]|nr:BLUF domain-containing protein [Anaerolineae bacterium]